MKKLRVLAMSDLHLGEPNSILFNSGDAFNVLDVTATKIRELSRGGEQFEDGVEELILVGDVVDLSEATAKEAYPNARAFFDALVRAGVVVDKVIYVVGNHDHHVWVEALEEQHGTKSYGEVRPKTCTSTAPPSRICRECLPAEFVGKMELRYPYCTVETRDDLFFFDHGHLFSHIVGGLPGSNRAIDLEGLENRLQRTMETLWYRGTTWIAQKLGQARETVYDFVRRLADRPRRPDRGTDFVEDNKPLLDDGLWARIMWYLQKVCRISECEKAAQTKAFHFVFGHTHNGGRVLAADRKFRLDGRFINVWNTGGWLVPSEVFSPDAYLFYIANTPGGAVPGAYKLASQEKPSYEGDYPRDVLTERLKKVGK